MNFLDLQTGYVLLVYTDYTTFRKTKELIEVKGRQIALAKELKKLLVIEYKQYLQTISQSSFKNYHEPQTANLKATAKESFQTALEVLEQLNGYKAQYIIIVRK